MDMRTPGSSRQNYVATTVCSKLTPSTQQTLPRMTSSPHWDPDILVTSTTHKKGGLHTSAMQTPSKRIAQPNSVIHRHLHCTAKNGHRRHRRVLAPTHASIVRKLESRKKECQARTGIPPKAEQSASMSSETAA